MGEGEAVDGVEGEAVDGVVLITAVSVIVLQYP